MRQARNSRIWCEKGENDNNRGEKAGFQGRLTNNLYLCPWFKQPNMMNRTLAKIVSLPGTLIHSLVIPLFAFLFTLYYQPRMEYDILSMQHSSFAFNVTILFCIVLGSVLLSRFSLYALGRFRSILGKYYIHSLMSDYQTWFLVIFIRWETRQRNLYCAPYIVMRRTFLWPSLNLTDSRASRYPVNIRTRSQSSCKTGCHESFQRLIYYSASPGHR